MLAVGLLGGLLLIGVTPPFQVPDEPAHFFHVYAFATGAPLERTVALGTVATIATLSTTAAGQHAARGVRLPASLPALAGLCDAGLPFHPERRLPPGLLAAAWRIQLAPERSAILSAGLLSPYGPVPYLGAIPAVALGRLAGARPLVLLYLARLGNLALALALVWAAVRITPVLRWLFALVALTPMAMFERSSAAADAFTDAIALLLAACVLRLAFGAYANSRRRAAGMTAVAMLLAATKAVYFLLDGLIFMVQAARLGSARRAAGVRGGAVAAILAGAGMSWWTARFYFTLVPLRPGVQPLVQLRGVMAAPLHFLGVAAADPFRHAARYLVGFVGNFGWLDTPLPPAAVVLWAVMLLAAALTGGDRTIRLEPWQRCLAAAAVAVTVLALSVAQYLAWTPLGSGEIDGLQGRYYLPVAPAAALLVYNRRWAGRWPAGPGAVWRLGGVSVAYTLATLVRIWFRYHGA